MVPKPWAGDTLLSLTKSLLPLLVLTAGQREEEEREREREREREHMDYVVSDCPWQKEKGLRWAVKDSLNATVVKYIERRPQLCEDGEKSIVNG